MKKHILKSACVASIIFSPNLVYAQTAGSAEMQRGDIASPDTSKNSGAIADIIVTAERRASSVQRTAIAISAVDSSALRKSGISNLEGLSDNIPNLSFQRNSGDAMIFIRGIGYNSVAPGNEARVALYRDGIYQSRNQAALLGFYDVDRVEVLRGPQGTLYGRNAIAGTINIITKEPGDQANGYFTGTVGDYGLIGTEGAVGGALSSTVQARISFRTVDRNGYGRNLTTGEEVNDERSRSVRGTLKFEPSADLTVRLSADYSREKDHNGGYRYGGPGNTAVVPTAILLGGAIPSDKQDAAGFGPKQNLKTYGFSAQVDFNLSNNTTLTSLSGYRHFVASNDSNLDGTTAELSRIYITERSNAFSQELRLSQKIGDFADLIIGGYYFHEVNSARNDAPLTGALTGILAGIIGATPPPDFDPNQLYEFYGSYGRVKTNAEAIFGQINIHLTDKLELDLGARYSHEKKRIFEEQQIDLFTPFVLRDAFNTALDPVNGLLGLGQANQSAGWSSFDPKATLSYQATKDTFLYATFSRGFKSGGFNVGNVQPAFSPEKLTNYEIGIKSDFFDRRLRVNLSAFNYDYKNLQESVVEVIQLVVKNATSARIRGVEAEITAQPVDDLRLSLNAAYLDGKFKKFFDTDPAFAGLGVQDLKGNQLPNSPKWQVGGEIGYTIHTGFGDVTPRANVNWYDRVYFNHFNTIEASQPSRTMVNLYLGWTSPDGSWSAAGYVKNLTNDTYYSNVIVAQALLGFPKVALYGAPRTVGVSLTKSF